LDLEFKENENEIMNSKKQDLLSNLNKNIIGLKGDGVNSPRTRRLFPSYVHM